jgi:hypothetical protein
MATRMRGKVVHLVAGRRLSPRSLPFVDADGAAEFLGITHRRVLEIARDGEIPGHPMGRGKRRTWRFRLSELAEALVAKHPEHANRERSIMYAGGSQAVPKRFERGKLTFTGDVLQEISVVGRQQKFANLLKRLTVGA